MFTTVIALLCSVAEPVTCYNKVVTNTDLNPSVTFVSCALIGQLVVSEWMDKEGLIARGWRLQNYKCIAGNYVPKVPA